MNEDTNENVQKGSYWWRLVKLNSAEWPYALLGSVGSIMAGVVNPIFALIISELLAVYYITDKDKMQKEVQKYVLIYVGVGVITLGIYVLQHYYFGIVGENLTARVRELMFKGESMIFHKEINLFQRMQVGDEFVSNCYQMNGRDCIMLTNMLPFFPSLIIDLVTHYLHFNLNKALHKFFRFCGYNKSQLCFTPCCSRYM